MNRKERGVTLVALVITVVVLLIIASIAVYSGSDTVRKAKLEELRTNMLLIEAKAKGLVEEVNFKIGLTKPEDAEYAGKKEKAENEVYVGAGLEKANGVSAPASIPVSECYKVTDTTLQNWGLEDMEKEEGEEYLIKFDDVNATVEVYNTLGYEGKYSLTEIDNIEE